MLVDFFIFGLLVLLVMLVFIGVVYVEVFYINFGEEDGEMWGVMIIGSDDFVVFEIFVNI